MLYDLSWLPTGKRAFLQMYYPLDLATNDQVTAQLIEINATTLWFHVVVRGIPRSAIILYQYLRTQLNQKRKKQIVYEAGLILPLHHLELSMTQL